VERAAVRQLRRALRHHPRRVDVLGLLVSPLLLFQFLFDPVLKIRNRIAANTKFDQMQRHYGIPIYSCDFWLGTTRMRVAPSATCASAAAERSVTVPSVVATRVCSIFMASIMARRCPRTTCAPGSTRTWSTLPCMGARTMPLVS